MCRLRPRSSDLATPSTIGMPFALRPSIGLTGAKSEVARRVVEASHQPRGDVAKWFHVDRAPNNRTPGPNLGTTPRPTPERQEPHLACSNWHVFVGAVTRPGRALRVASQLSRGRRAPACSGCSVGCAAARRCSLTPRLHSCRRLDLRPAGAPAGPDGSHPSVTAIAHLGIRLPASLSQLHRRPSRHARIGLLHCRRIALKTPRAQSATSPLLRRW